MSTLRELIELGKVSMDTPVLGNLAMTDDGAIIGDGGVVWLVADNWRDGKHIYSVTASIDLNDPDRRERFADARKATELMLTLLPAPSAPPPASKEGGR